jgi:hypothetical protein
MSEWNYEKIKRDLVIALHVGLLVLVVLLIWGSACRIATERQYEITSIKNAEAAEESKDFYKKAKEDIAQARKDRLEFYKRNSIGYKAP